MHLPILADARSYIRPHAKRLKGTAQFLFNDLNEALGFSARVDEPLWAQWRRVMGNSREILAGLPEPTGPRVLFATGYGWGAAMLVLETTLIAALRLRGAQPIALRCDKALPACEWNRFGNFEPSPGEFGPSPTVRTRLEQCRICTENIDSVYELLPTERIAFAQFLEKDDLERLNLLIDGLAYEDYGRHTYRGIQVGEHAYSSVMRATLRGTLLDDAETRWLFRRYLLASILVVDLTNRAIDATRPDRIVAVHGIYVTHGTICEVARFRGIPVVVYGTPYRRSTIWLSHDDTYHRTLISEPPAIWEDLEMTPARVRRVEEYLASKRFGGRDYAAYHADANNDADALYEELGLDRKKPIISAFTNVLWDAQLYYSRNAFSDMLEWLFETIRYFEHRADLQLVIRIHPAEAKGTLPTNQPLLAEIEREFPVLPENVKVIRPESNLSSYTLAEASHAALIYGARMGVEIAALGTPLVVAGETFNRGKGYSYDVETREEYFELLDRIQDLPRNDETAIRRARTYAYHYYYRLMIDFKLFSVKDGIHLTGPQLEFTSLDALLPGVDPALDVICDGILDAKTPFFFDSLERQAAESTIAA